MNNSIVWLIAGAVIGWLVTFVIRRRQPILLLNIIVGSLGAFMAGYILLPSFHISITSFSLQGLLISLGGSLVLLVFVNFFIIREHTVTNAIMEDQWNRVSEKIHPRWSRLTEEDIDKIDRKHDQLVGMIQERYGITKEEAEEQLQRFLYAVTTKASWLSFFHSA